MSSSVAYLAVQTVLEWSREDVIQRQREEIERRKMAFEDLRCQVIRMLAPADEDSDRSIAELFGDTTESEGDGSVAD